jgi:phage replication-related protein YjqB (UPF0714/DUF867 family)
MAALSDDALKELTDYIEVQGLAWAKEFIAYRKSWMESKGIKATGELINSLELEITSILDQAAKTKIAIAFNDYGRFIEIKNLYVPGGGTDYIESLEKWIEKKGYRQKMTANYLATRKVRTVPANILNQLAWAIAISRKNRVARRRQWYNKPKSAAITELYNKVAAGLPERVAQELKNAFKS